MTRQKVMVAATISVCFFVPGTAGADERQAAAQACIAVVMPSVQGAEGSAGEMSTAVRDLFGNYLTGPAMRAIPLDARLPALAAEEARQKECRYLLAVTITQKHHGQGVMGRVIGEAAANAAWRIPGGAGAGAVARSTAASAVQAISTIAQSTHAKDEIQMKFTLTDTSGSSAVVSKTDKARAQTDREDLLTPLVERAAIAIVEAVLGKK